MIQPNCADLLLASVPLFKVDDNRVPVASCSGCLVAYRGLRVLLTVYHSTGNQMNWEALDRYDPITGMRLYPLGPLHSIFSAKLGDTHSEPVDFAFARVPDDFNPTWQHITPLGGIELEIPRLVLTSSLTDKPATDVRYGFAGIVHPGRSADALQGDSQCENDLTLISEDSDWYHFSLNHPHPGDCEYRGCSGAPVLDASCTLVALLVGRSALPDAVRALPLARYRAALDLSLGLNPEIS
jgi:hypothetical protein